MMPSKYDIFVLFVAFPSFLHNVYFIFSTSTIVLLPSHPTG